MYLSLPQISRTALDHLITQKGIHGSKITITDERIPKYRINVAVEDLAPSNRLDFFDEKFIYFEPYGNPFKEKNKFIDFRQNLIDLAKEYGFPEKIKSGSAREFDQKLAKLVWAEGKKLGLNVSNASIEGTWNYLQGVIALDLVAWRWINYSNNTLNKERVNRVERGALSNVWWRYCVLTNNGDHDYEDWMDWLTQDDVVQIIERTKMRGYAPIIIPFAKRIAKKRKEQKKGVRSASDTDKLIRAAAKRMRIYVGIRNSWYLKDKQEANFESLIDNIFLEAKRMIQ